MRLIFLLAILAIAGVVGFAYVSLSWISTPLNLAVDQIDPQDIKELRVQLLNRPDGLEDIGPVNMLPADFPALLAPLRSATPEADRPGMPWLGEYQIRFQDDRRLTVRLRWERKGVLDTRPALAGAVGTGLAGFGEWVPPLDESVVWYVVEGRIYRAGLLRDLLRTAEDCVARAKQ